MATSYVWQETGQPDNILTEAGDSIVMEDHGAALVGTAQVRFLRTQTGITIEQTRIGP